MRYALLDWDNTIRNGYTLFSFIDYLIEIDILNQNFKEIIDDYFEKYKLKKISHDYLALISCKLFAQQIKGFSVTTMDQIIDDYYSVDKKNIYRISDVVFRTLKAYNILPIIISGAPECIINRYKEFSIYQIYGFSVENSNGVFSGRVQNNYGHNKKRIVKEIQRKMGNKPPVIAFGDSQSDYPMLLSAKKSIIVSDNSKTPPHRIDSVISGNSSEQEVVRIMKELLSGTNEMIESL